MLRVAQDLELPLELVVQKIAVLARSGAGKTNTAVDIVEELLEAGQQVVVIDPPGQWWGLRTSADGKKPGYPIIVFGGIHGDLPLESTSGSFIADLVVDRGISLILDLSEFESDAAMYRLVEAFVIRLYARKNRVRDPMMLVVEEADELAPQTVRPEMAKLLHGMQRISKRGRSRGIGSLWITQRTATLSWEVLSQIEVLIALQTTAPLDIRAIDNWIKNVAHAEGQQTRQQLLSEIAELSIGTGYVWSPSWLRIFRKVQFRKRRTFDSSATPKPGERQIQVRTRADINLEGLRESLAETIERARENDPAELKKRITQLERNLREQARHTADVAANMTRTVEVEKRVEVPVPVLTAEDRHLLGSVHGQIQSFEESLRPVRDLIKQLLNNAAIREAVSTKPAVVQSTVQKKLPDPVRTNIETQSRDRDTGELTASQIRIMNSLATLQNLGIETPSRTAVAALAGYKLSGTVQAMFAQLNRRSYIEFPGTGIVRLTDSGWRNATPQTGIHYLEDFHSAWMQILNDMQRKMLDVIISCYPGTITRRELAEATGYQLSGTFQAAIAQFKDYGIVEYPDTGHVKASDILFPELPRRT